MRNSDVVMSEYFCHCTHLTLFYPVYPETHCFRVTPCIQFQRTPHIEALTGSEGHIWWPIQGLAQRPVPYRDYPAYGQFCLNDLLPNRLFFLSPAFLFSALGFIWWIHFDMLCIVDIWFIGVQFDGDRFSQCRSQRRW